ncbi:hypothetical protein EV2_010658 [Malus domestica]
MYPDWLSDKDKLDADTKHWKAIVDKSYLTGLGIDWSKIRNVMDMKTIFADVWMSAFPMDVGFLFQHRDRPHRHFVSVRHQSRQA